MTKRSRKLLLITVILIIIQFLVPLKQTQAGPTSVAFIVDFSASMKETIGSKSKIDIAREIVGGILDEIQVTQDTGLTLYGHRDKNACDDIELIVVPKGSDRKDMKKKLMESEPGGKAPIAQALKMTAERLKAPGDLMTIVLITDGKTNCEGDLIKTAREIKEIYGDNIIFHVIGLNPSPGEDSMSLFRVACAGYGERHRVKKKSGSDKINRIVKSIAEKLNNPEIHMPKVEDHLDDMVLIPAGEFLMGSARPEDDSNEHPGHTVYLDSYYIDRYEVTQKQYKEVMKENPSLWIRSDRPVESVSWSEAKKYCEKVGKRLPTEAEWEKAAEGGRDDIWSGTSSKEKLEEYAWFANNAGGRTHPVGQKKPNGYGIYDMSGNVSEWVSDWFDKDYYRNSPKENPKGPNKNGLYKIMRGGCWDYHVIEIRTSTRYSQYPDVNYGTIGFRCAKSVE